MASPNNAAVKRLLREARDVARAGDTGFVAAPLANGASRGRRPAGAAGDARRGGGTRGRERLGTPLAAAAAVRGGECGAWEEARSFLPRWQLEESEGSERGRAGPRGARGARLVQSLWWWLAGRLGPLPAAVLSTRWMRSEVEAWLAVALLSPPRLLAAPPRPSHAVPLHTH